MEDLKIREKAENEMQGFISMAKSGIKEKEKAGSRWRGFKKRSPKGRPASFDLSGAKIEDPFAPKAGEYYKSPDHYNQLRKIRREREKNIKESQLELALI